MDLARGSRDACRDPHVALTELCTIVRYVLRDLFQTGLHSVVPLGGRGELRPPQDLGGDSGGADMKDSPVILQQPRLAVVSLSRGVRAAGPEERGTEDTGTHFQQSRDVRPTGGTTVGGAEEEEHATTAAGRATSGGSVQPGAEHQWLHL